MIAKSLLEDLYLRKGQSVATISKRLRCSQGQVNYWIAAHGIPKRSISDALYQKWNPNGDPFRERYPATLREAMLYGIGIGLYWGEGTKSNKTSVRLGNTDPRLVKTFIQFLEVCYGVDKQRLRFGLQIFGDMDAARARSFWMRELGVLASQFHKQIIITPYRGVGNYRKKTEYGVLTVYFNNRKLRDIICRAIDEVSVAHVP